MNKNLSQTIQHIKKYRSRLIYSLLPVVFVCLVAILIGILSPKPNDNISPSSDGYLFENVNPQFEVGFGDVMDTNAQYVRFESKSDVSNPFEQEEVTMWDRVKSVFSKKRGFEMRLTEVRFGETDSSFVKDIGQEIVSVIEAMAIEDIKTDTEVIEVGRLLGEFDDNPQSKETVINKDVYPGIDVEYQILEGMGVKEEIIIRNMDEYNSGCGVDNECLLPLNEFVFDLTLDEGVVMNEAWNAVETTYYLTDADGDYLAHFLPSFAVDYIEARTNDVDMAINHVDENNYEVVVTLNPDWLFSNDRVFPIRIDPSVVHDTTAEFDSGYTYNTEVVVGPKVQLTESYSGAYRSPEVELSGTYDLDSIEWVEYGASTNGGETPYSTTNLVAKWDFNEVSGTTADNEGSCGINCDGTLSGMVTTGQDVVAGSGWTGDNRRWGEGALMFDGGNDIVNVGSDSSIDDIATKTISFWLKANSYSGDSEIINKGDMWFVAFDEENDKYIFGQNFSTSNGRWSVPLTSIPLGEWHSVVITYDNSSIGNAPVWYINGTSVSVTEESAPEGSLSSDASASLSLGRNYSGTMDTVSLYSRILTPSEILSNYNSGNIEFRFRTSIDGNTWTDWSGSETPLTYEYYKTGTIGSDQVEDTLTDVSVLVSVINNNFKSIANDGHVAQPDGGDIYFTDSTGATQYRHELEKYVPSTGEVVVCVEIPSVSSSVDTVFRMYYGDNYSVNRWDDSGDVQVPAISPLISFSIENVVLSSSDMSQLDDSSLQMKQGSDVSENLILHYNLDETNGDLAGDDIFDSSGNNYDGEINGTDLATGVVDGVVGYARDFNGIDDYILSPTGSGYNLGTDSLSISMWVKTDAVATTQTFLSSGDSSGDSRAYFGIYDSKWDMGIATSDWNTGDANITATTDWTHIGIVFDSDSSTASLYINGVYSFSKSYSDYSLLADWTVGSLGDHSSYFFDGKIDDLRIYANGISESDIYTTYSMGEYDRSTHSVASVDISNESILPFWIASDELGTNMELIYGESRYANSEIDGDTKGFWHMDEEFNNTCSGGVNDVCDSSGNDYDGAIIGDAAVVEGLYGKARDFGSSDDVINLGDQDLVDSSTNFTISSWVYTNSTDSAHHRVFQEELVVSVGQYGTQVMAYLSSNESTWTHTSNSLGNLEVGMWHYIVWAKEGGSLQVYIDGTLTGTMSAPETLGSTSGDNLIGGGTSDQIWDGMLDEVRIDTVVRSADDIRQVYEIGSRTHPIVVNFKADLQEGNLITGSGDTSFSIDERSYGTTNYVEHIDVGETIIVKENYGGTTYVAQGEIASVNTSTGASTVSSWDSGSTFPTSGFTAEATVFKWQREYVDIRYLLSEDINAVTDLTVRRITNKGASLWIDDFRKATYFGDSSGATFVEREDVSYVQYESIFTKWGRDVDLGLYLTQVDIDYTKDGPTTEQIMRHGKWFNGGEEQGFWWAGD